MTWQPIETAPQDGTRIQVFKDGEQYVAFWTRWQKWGVNTKSGDDWTPYHGIGPKLWDEIVLDAGPSHWKPLDNPPEISPAA